MTGRLERLTWGAVGTATVVVAGWALLDPSLYDGLIDPVIRPGAVGQDVVSVVAGVWLCSAAARRDLRPRARLVALGVLGYLFYGYGIFAIERMYNQLYLIYLLLFSAAFWSLILGVGQLIVRPPVVSTLSRWLHVTSAVGALLQPAIFYPLWISMLIPLMRDRNQVDSLYSIFVLDLCFVMPAFLFVGVGLLRHRAWARLAAPAMFVLGSVLMTSLALAELVKPAFGQPVTAAGLLPPLALTALFGVLAGMTMNGLRQAPKPDPRLAPSGPLPTVHR
jgi:hypothetical protein